jgi:ABC-type phosphate transport system substrate-binding protein
MSALTQKMGRMRNRAGLLVGASAAVLAIAGVSASSAAAAVPPTCPENVNITGMGSSLQKTAQIIWTGRAVETVTEPSMIPNPGATNTEPNSYRSKCAAKTKPPTVTYGSSGSGKGLNAFGYNGAALNNNSNRLAFVGTDDGPTRKQIENAESSIAGNTQAVILPVSQTAIAVMVHLPTGCTLTGGITWQDLNKVWGGKNIKSWRQFSTASNKEVGGVCDHEITRVVRKEGSGTTTQFKNYLQVLKEKEGAEQMPCAVTIKPGPPPVTTKEWSEVELVGPAPNEEPNTLWPCSVAEGGTPIAKAEGGGAVAAAVESTANSIGYAALPDAEGHLSGGATLAKLQNGENLGSKTYAEPGEGTNKVARCVNSRYTIPAEGVPGASGGGLSVNWSTTFGGVPNIAGSEYPLCTLTYVAAWNTYSEAKYGTGHAAIQALVNDYITNYMVPTGTGLGQKAIVGHWYSAMPTNVQASAEFIAKNLE